MTPTPPNRRDRRFQVALPIIKEVRLVLWAYTRGVSKTRMAEAILIDRVSNANNWDEVCRDLKQEAEVLQVPVEDLIQEILKREGFSDSIKVDEIDWTCLLDGKEPDISKLTPH